MAKNAQEIKDTNQFNAKDLITSYLGKKFFASPIVLNNINQINHSVFSYRLSVVNENRFEQTKTTTTALNPQFEKYADLKLVKFEPSFQDKTWQGIKENSITQIRCERCYGQEKVPCGPCNAKGRQYDAGTKQYYDCHYCQGTGKAACPLCQGSGKVTQYTDANIVHLYKQESGFLNNQPISVKKQNPIEVLKINRKPSDKEMSNLPDEVKISLKKLLDEKLSKEVVQHELKLFEYPLLELEYACNKKNYSVFYDNQNNFIKGKYPKNKPLIGWMFVAFLNVLFLFPTLLVLLSFLVVKW